MLALVCGKAVAPAGADIGPAAAAPQIVPLPASMTTDAGQTFTLAPGTQIVVASGDDAAVPVANDLAAILRPSTGYALPVSQGSAPSGSISFALSGSSSLGSEGYQLDVTSSGVQIQAYAAAGLFYGVQTLRQLFSPWIESPTVQPGPWTIQGVHITDSPRYPYRGIMVDIARHFEPPDAIKKIIDEASAYKINVLHLHVSDDQGFRIVINGRPELTDIGSQFSVGTGGRTADPGGFWTQAQYLDVVAYAAAHFMKVMPEVDTPGHNNAIIMSYNTGGISPFGIPYPILPDINCSTHTPPVWDLTGDVGYSALCPGSTNTWAILTDIITQLSGMSSSPYYDLGGDEVPTTVLSTDQYNAFVTQEAGIVRAQGKNPMGWADISSAGFSPTDSLPGIAEYWNNASPTGSGGDTGRIAVQKGMKVVMAPANHTYLDQKQVSSSPLGLTWACTCDVSSFYNWGTTAPTGDPATYIPSRPFTAGSTTVAAGSTTLGAAAAAGDTNVKVASTTNFAAGQSVNIDSGANLETGTVASVGTQTRSTTLAALTAVGATNIKVASVTGLSTGDTLNVDTGANLETRTVATVGTAQRTATTLSAATVAGATNIKVASVTNMVAGETVSVDTGANIEFDTITVVGTSGSSGTGVTLATPLTLAHASGVAARDLGTGVTLNSALTLAHASGAAVFDPGTGITLSAPLASAHAVGAALVGITPAGSTTIKVAAVTGFTVGAAITIDTGANLESATISAVGTAGATGTGLTLSAPLTLTHLGAVAVATPATTLPAVTDSNIIGVEGSIWGETVVTLANVQFMVFPRLPVLAELAWSPAVDPNRTLASFESRMASDGARWQVEGQNFYPSTQIPWRVDVSAPDIVQKTSELNGPVASIAAPGATTAQVTTTVDWGDGSNSAGTVTGVAATNETANGIYTASGDHTYAADGVYHATVTASRTGSTASAPFNVTVDTTAPTTTATLSPPTPAGLNGWYLVPVQVTLSASDATAGVASTMYTIDGGSPQTYSSPFTISADGSHAVSFWSTDNAGNSETPQSITVKVDQNDPVTTATLTPGLHNGWYASPTLTLSGNDGTGSGIAHTDYSLDGGPWTVYSTALSGFSTGSHFIQYDSTDNAGRVEAVKLLAFKVDAGLPKVTITTPADGDSFPLDKVVTAKFKCAAEPAKESGIDTCVGTVADGANLDTSTVGTHAFTVTATDKAGNVTTVTTHYTVTYTWSGFFSPITNSEDSGLNLVHAGDLIKLGFGLNGDRGTNIFAAGFPTSVAVSCPSWTPHTVPAGGAGTTAGLSYGVASGHYTYGWQTDAAWAGTCRQFQLQLNDGTTTVHSATFMFFS